jgi:catechol 2,3-dioxygenase-like lactoylglutathione lyase family enzyme
MNIRRIKETCIYVSDLQRTKAFYADQLGLPVISLVENRHIFFKAGDSVLLCFIADKTQKEIQLPPHGAFGCIHFAFEVDGKEYQTALEQVRNCGITILHQHVWKGNLRSFYFNDPDNNLVEIIEVGLWD